MALDPRVQFATAYLVGWVADADLELVRFTCTLCGETSEPLPAGHAVPETFRGVPHADACPIYGQWRAAA